MRLLKQEAQNKTSHLLRQTKRLNHLKIWGSQHTNDPEKFIKKLDYADALASFELLYRNIEKQKFVAEQKGLIKASMKKTDFDMLSNFNLKLEQNLADDVEALKSLVAEKSIVIQRSYLGNSVVILDRRHTLKKCLWSSQKQWNSKSWRVKM